MGLFRITHVNFEEIFEPKDFDTEHENEWEDSNRLNEPSWDARYDYEASLIVNILNSNKQIKTILEVGSGPGVLSQKVQSQIDDVTYHLIDKPFAEKYFKDNNFKGEFFVKDLANGFDKTGLLDQYDMIICNDFIEHAFNPHAIVKTFHELCHDDGIVFISNPNWRMGHQFIYRGLFDFDNFVYMFYVHKFTLQGFYGSPLKTPDYPRISSETMLSDDHLRDWNHYMIFTKTEQE
jgi:2-polyprenyl-3-methyl-5-hydroxy-6-metoxy-1,4-benzoquinol methylase